jgi:N-acetyl-alpha-D-glucosaminyl L-malate synthase BshA
MKFERRAAQVRRYRLAMSIAMLCHTGPGGSSRVALRLADALEHRGHRVSVVPAGPWRTMLEPTWDDWRLAQLERRVEATIRENGVQVLHYHYAWPFAHLVRGLKRRLGSAAPLVVGTLHGTDVTHPPDDAAIAALRHTDEWTTVSRPYAALAQERLLLGRRPVVIPNFLDAARFPHSSDFTDPRARGRRPRLVHVSNFRPVKDPQGVAHIFAAVREHQDAELWLIGDGPELPRVMSVVRCAGLERDVRVFGYRADVARLLAQCDVLVMSSLEESFCLAALEAMAGGLAVVGSAVGGFAELAEHERSAMLYRQGDYATAARLVSRLLTDHPLRLGVRRAAAERARTFSVAAAVERYEAIYGPALASTRIRSAAH